MKMWIIKFLGVFGLVVLLAACLTPSGEPAPATGPGTSGSLSDTELMEMEGGEDRSHAPDPTGDPVGPRADTVAANPTWTASSPGGVDRWQSSLKWVKSCGYPIASVRLSLKDRTAPKERCVKVELKVMNPKTGDGESLDLHHLHAISDYGEPPDFLHPTVSHWVECGMIDLPRLPRLPLTNPFLRPEDLTSEEEQSAEEQPAYLKAFLLIYADKEIGKSIASCGEIHEAMGGKRYLLTARYRQGGEVLEGQEAFSLDPDSLTTELKDLVLNKSVSD